MAITMSPTELGKMFIDASSDGIIPLWRYFEEKNSPKDSKQTLVVDSLTGQIVKCDDFFKDRK